MSFSHLKHLDPAGKTRTYRFPVDLPGSPTLDTIFGGTSNKSLTSAVLKRNAKNKGKRVADGSDTIREACDLERDLFPGHAVTGWNGVKNDQGKPVKFSVGECRDFLYALPDWIIQDLSRWLSRPVNFIDVDEELPATDKEVEAQAGN